MISATAAAVLYEVPSQVNIELRLQFGFFNEDTSTRMSRLSVFYRVTYITNPIGKSGKGRNNAFAVGLSCAYSIAEYRII